MVPPRPESRFIPAAIALLVLLSLTSLGMAAQALKQLVGAEPQQAASTFVLMVNGEAALMCVVTDENGWCRDHGEVEVREFSSLSFSTDARNAVCSANGQILSCEKTYDVSASGVIRPGVIRGMAASVGATARGGRWW